MSDIGAQFRALHSKGNPFLLPNAWDVGSAVILESLGAKAVATTSAGYCFSRGQVDGGTLTRDEALAHAQDLVSVLSVPVTGDFENGFGDAPEDVVETIKLSAEIGLAGCCIEDTALPGEEPYDYDLSVERIRAAASAAKSLQKDYVLIARADGLMLGQYDLDEAIRRVQAFEAAGADGVYVPALPDIDAAQRLVDSVDVPVSILTSGSMAKYSWSDFARIGAARLSTGGSLSRVAYGAAIKTMQNMQNGNFDGLTEAIAENRLNELLTKSGGGRNA
jgi:2-methylisocitrate lyase-like PEP mutase family enzyme